MRVLGIDPGLATVGVGLLSTEPEPKPQPTILDFCTIETSPSLSTSQRLLEISDDLSEYIREHKPDLVVVEKLFFETNRKTAMDVAQARGVILVSVEDFAIPILEPTPLELKSAVTGDGQADKLQMKTMLERTFNTSFDGVKDDAVDAVGLALYGATCQTQSLPLAQS